jgi:hypothetical protein
MAANKPTKLLNFFEGHRRKASLNAWTHLRTKAGESRIKLELRLPMLNEPETGINGAISEAFMVMRNDDSKIARTSLNVELEGMTVEMFSTDGAKSPAVSSTGVKLLKLALVAAGDGEKRTVTLTMTGYVPASMQLRDWAWEHLHADFHLEAVYSQSEMDFSDLPDDEEPAEEDEDAEEPELDPDNEPVLATPKRPGKKSGPKDLAAFHAAQPN